MHRIFREVNYNNRGLLFICRLIGAYLLFYTSYNHYLNYFASALDPYTLFISQQINNILLIFDYQYSVYSMDQPISWAFWLADKPIFGIHEGCNGASITILFLSFIFAYKTSAAKMIPFMIGGSLIIALINFIRILLLAILYVEYPECTDTFHNILFPAAMYGLILSLWMFWIKLSHVKKT